MTLSDSELSSPSQSSRAANRSWLRLAWLTLAVLSLACAAWMGRYKYLWHSNSLTFVLDRWTHRVCVMGANNGKWFVRCSDTRLP